MLNLIHASGKGKKTYREYKVDREQSIIVLATLLAITGIQGCKWQDDFRAREQPTYLQQPQYLKPVPKPTLNVDSKDYQGDDTGRTAKEIKNTRMPSIDDRKPIPPIWEDPRL
jgi:hypothetical protein